MPRPSWKPEDMQYLKDNYGIMTAKEIAKHLNKTEGSVNTTIYRHQIKKPIGYTRRLSDLKILLDGSLQTNYWMGFLLADGHFHKKGNTVRLDQAIGDIEHLRVFKQYINLIGKETLTKPNHFKNSQGSASVTAINSTVIPELVKRYDICSTKTYNPPDFTKYNLTGDQWMALIIGFIDGDGYIQLANSGTSEKYKRLKITLEIHSSWKDNLTFMKNFLYKQSDKSHRLSPPKINSYGLCSTQIASSKVIDNMVKFIKDNNLYVLNRKWCKYEQIVYQKRYNI